MGSGRGTGFCVRLRKKDTYIISSSVICWMWTKYHSLEEDPGVTERSTEKRKHSKVFEGRGVLLMTSVSSIGHGRKVCMVQEWWKVGPVRCVQCPKQRRVC